MPSTVFSAGVTKVAATWLNEVNSLVFGLGDSADAAKGPALVTYNKQLAYASGTVGAKLRESVSVRDFGAVGDGIVDDTTAIQNAINFAQTNGQALYFPAGNYRCNGSSLTATKSIRLFGDRTSPEFSSGARLFRDVAGDLLVFNPSGGGLSFCVDGLFLKSTVTSPSSSHLINVVDGNPGYNSWRVTNCCFSNPQGMAIRATGNDIRILNNTFDVSGISGNCIQLGSNAAGDEASDVLIEGNDFFNIVVHCVLIYNAYGVVIANNRVTQPNTSSKTVAFVDAYDSTPTQCKRIAITGNTLAGVSRVFGVNGGSDITIVGNVGSDLGIGTGETYDAIHLAGTVQGVVVSGNSLKGSYDTKSFMRAGANNSDVVVGPNVWMNSAGSGAALVLGAMTGKVDPANHFVGFVSNISANDYVALGYVLRQSATLTYGTTVNTNVLLGDDFTITVTNGTGFTIADPTNASNGNRITYTIRNTSGGAMGTVTWGSAFKLATWTSPATGNSRSITFRFNGTNWVEQGRTASDVPN